MTVDSARDIVSDVSYFGTMMVSLGMADGMVSGATHTTADTIRPALQLVKTRPGVSIVSSVFFMCLADRVLVYGDCAVNPNPSAEQLADIAIPSAETAASSGSTRGWRCCPTRPAARVRARRSSACARRPSSCVAAPQLSVEGPIQYDAAVDAAWRARSCRTQVAGRATVFIFPDLNTGNNTYKAVQRTARPRWP